MAPKILIIEDSKMFSALLRKKIQDTLSVEIHTAETCSEARGLINSITDFSIALVDLYLPDSNGGEAVDLCIENRIPTVVMTASLSDDVQEFVWTKKVVDYVLKEGPYSVDYLVEIVDRIEKNKQTKVLVVDDSLFARRHLVSLLNTHCYQTLEAGNGLAALKLIEIHDDIMLVLTDYNMPECDGFELVRRIRARYSPEEMAVIGLSSEGNHKLSVKFMKYGANDFMSKPFISEQLYCRINQNIKIVENFKTLKQVSLTDYLTKLYNRRYLFETGEMLFESVKRSENGLIIAMIDIDHFKLINDNYGHDVGDAVLKKIGFVLKECIRKSDVLTRFGGEEFCVIANNMNPEEAVRIFNDIREQISNLTFEFKNSSFKVTVSVGLCGQMKDTFIEMIKTADKKLYEAKRLGRNRVCM